MALRALHLTLPEPLARPVSLIGQAAIPLMLMLLGAQLAQTTAIKRYREIAVGVFLRLVVGAGVGAVLAALFRLEGLARSVAIIQSATPTAVASALMAIEFDADADYVSSVVFVSTLLSAFTLTALLAFIR